MAERSCELLHGLGDLSGLEPQNAANILVVAAANAWNSVPTAAVQIARKGRLAEDVNGSNVAAGANGPTLPADIRSTAVNYPVAVVYDQDGSVINALLGAGASNPDDCRDNGVYTNVDNLATNGSIVHALMVINGLCAQDASHVALLQYLLVRAWGRILGLDWSAANETMFTDGSLSSNGLAGWPILHPFERLCTPGGTNCMPTTTLRPDDVASVSRLYPVTDANLCNYPTKKLTAANTISIQGTVRFRNGQGMQGVSVIAQPLMLNTTKPDVRYTVSAVSGVLFQGNQGNIVTGPNDLQGNAWNRFGSDDAEVEGWFDLSAIPLPAGRTQADYQITLLPLNRMDTGGASVGPYTLSQVSPSGTMPSIVLHGLTTGVSVEQDFSIGDSAGDDDSGNDGSQGTAAAIPAGGEWVGRISGYGHAGWFTFWARASRQFTVEVQALDANGAGTTVKARPMLGLWNASDAAGSLPDLGILQPFNGAQTGLSLLRGTTQSEGQVILGIDDQRGDGRPDYLYRGRLFYADTVSPNHLPRSGGMITIRGVGFRSGNSVTVNGVNAAITGISPGTIVAMAPAAGTGVSGNVDVAVVDPKTQGSAVLAQAISYDAGNSDGLAIVTAPSGAVASNVPVPFTVRAIASDGVTSVGGVTVTFTVTKGSAILGCGHGSCAVNTTADGAASISVTPTTTVQTVVSAALSNGICVQAHFSGAPAPQIAALTPTLYLASGATYTWSPQVLVLNQGAPVPGAKITWTATAGATMSAASTSTSASGIAAGQVTAGPLNAGASAQINACLPANVACAQFSVLGVHMETAALIALSGAGQSISVGQVPAPVVLRVTDAVGDPVAGASVNFYQVLRLWTPSCQPTGPCPPSTILSSNQSAAGSGADGLVTLLPLSRSGVATRLNIMAVTGGHAALSFGIDTHP